jgi:hypothetical protein
MYEAQSGGVSGWERGKEKSCYHASINTDSEHTAVAVSGDTKEVSRNRVESDRNSGQVSGINQESRIRLSSSQQIHSGIGFLDYSIRRVIKSNIRPFLISLHPGPPSL